jgi:hypothetical protein
VCVCVLIYKDIRKLVSLRPCIHVPQATASGGSWTRVRHVAHPQWWAPILYHHDCILSRDGHCITLVWYPIEFHASGEGPRGHEILHHAAVPKIVLDGVSVVWESLLKELLKVFYGRLRLVLPLPTAVTTRTTLGPHACLPMPPSSSIAVVASR